MTRYLWLFTLGYALIAAAQPLNAANWGFQGLGDLPGGSFNSNARDVSADGAVVVGMGTRAAGSEAFRWTSGGGMVGLGDLPGGSFSSIANVVSEDGSVVLGRSLSESGTEAFRWTNDGGMVGLGDLPGGLFYSVANGVSADGSVIVGQSWSTSGAEAFRWTSGGGMIGLGDLPGGSFFSTALGVSADGSVIVGEGRSASGNEAFLWSASSGIVNLRELLISHGLDLTSWNLERATSISADGRTIVGSGTNPSGLREAWIATIPEPDTLALAQWAGVAFAFAALARHRRSRMSCCSREL